MTYEAECYAWDKPVLAKKLDSALAENERLRGEVESWKALVKELESKLEK